MGKRPSLPQKSKHLWRTNIPANLPPGVHTIEVEAIDKEDAINKAHRGMRHSLCWACSTHVTLDSPNEDVDSEVEEL